MPKGNRETTESERDREYRERQRVEAGEKLQGDRAEWLDEKGDAGRVAKEREES